MSRIDTRSNATAAQAQAASATTKNTGASEISSASSAQRIFKLQQRQDSNRKISTKKTKHLHAPSDISATDLQPLKGKNRDDVIGTLTRILVSLGEYESGEQEDQTTTLCKMMLGEHVRRLMLVQGTQVTSDGLKGSA